jgi:hypothetical protein
MREGTSTQNLLDGSTVTNGQRTLVSAPGSGIVLQDLRRIVREGSAIVFLDVDECAFSSPIRLLPAWA